MKRLFFGWMLVMLASAPTLYAQFCSFGIEPTDCSLPPKSQCVGLVLSCEVERRYSQTPYSWITPAPFGNNLPAVNQTNCDETFFFDIKKSSDDFANTLNSERGHWSHDDEIAFFKGPSARGLTFFDDTGSELFASPQFQSEDFFSGPNPSVYPSLTDNQRSRMVSVMRWHPTADRIFYQRQMVNASGTVTGGELVEQALDLSGDSLLPAQVLFTFNGYTISDASDDFKIAGGDGNDVHAGRFLLSLKNLSQPTASDQYAVYDFGKDSLVVPNITPGSQSYSETFHGEATFSQALFSLPNLPNFDYATVSASGLFILGVYSVPQGGTPSNDEGIYLLDLAGNIIQRKEKGTGTALFDRLLKRGDGHIEPGFFRDASQNIKEAIVHKATTDVTSNANQGQVNDYVNITNMTGPGYTQTGDIIVIYWDIAVDSATSALRHTAEARRILEWTGANGLSGDQYSLSHSPASALTSSFYGPISAGDLPSDYPFRLLMSTKPVNLSVSSAAPYYGEIVEMSLDESDPVPRRIVHHRITLGGPEYQPEAWLSRRGTGLFFKSHYGLGTQQDLYFIDLPPRTCKSVRDGVAPPLRMAESDDLPPSFTLYPNPLHSGGKLWLEADATTPETASASLRLISLDGRRIELWQGPLSGPGHALDLLSLRIQTVLPEVSSGIYVLELVDHLSQRRLYQEKVLVR